MKRYGEVIKIKPEQIEEYERMHEQVWPEVLKTIEACNIRNYTIFRRDTLLFTYFEYIGDNYALDMARMAANPKMREWWDHTDPMQEPLMERSEGAWWNWMYEVFHTD